MQWRRNLDRYGYQSPSQTAEPAGRSEIVSSCVTHMQRQPRQKHSTGPSQHTPIICCRDAARSPSSRCAGTPVSFQRRAAGWSTIQSALQCLNQGNGASTCDAPRPLKENHTGVIRRRGISVNKGVVRGGSSRLVELANESHHSVENVLRRTPVMIGGFAEANPQSQSSRSSLQAGELSAV